ncbi:MAG: hypothetical protein AABX07_03090 [Nanoarchaeota archaeon]
MIYPVLYSKGQLKVQEMAFVLVAIMIFFVLVAIFLLNFWISSLKDDTVSQRDEKSSEIALKLADSPEFAWSSKNNRCDNCVDIDKVFALKERINSGKAYKDFWSHDIGIIKVESLYPEKTGECTRANYPNCKTITLLNRTQEYSFSGGYIALCRHDAANKGSMKCELGQIYVSAKKL